MRPRTTARAGIASGQCYGVGFRQLPRRDTGDLLAVSVPGIDKAKSAYFVMVDPCI